MKTRFRRLKKAGEVTGLVIGAALLIGVVVIFKAAGVKANNPLDNA